MLKIDIAAARPGMTITRPILNESGMTVFGKGVVLTDDLIARIVALHAQAIYIEGRTPPKRPLAEELAALDRRFNNVTDDPAMMGLKAVVRGHIESLFEG